MAINENETNEKYAQAKAWGQAHARAADQARRDLGEAQKKVASLAAVEDELKATKAALAAAEAQIAALGRDAEAKAKQAAKTAKKADAFDAIRKALSVGSA